MKTRTRAVHAALVDTAAAGNIAMVKADKADRAMQLNPMTGDLWNDEGRFLKRLSCPLAATQGDMRAGKCRLCDRSILPLEGMSDAEVTKLLTATPDQCVAIASDAVNVRIVLK